MVYYLSLCSFPPLFAAILMQTRTTMATLMEIMEIQAIIMGTAIAMEILRTKVMEIMTTNQAKIQVKAKVKVKKEIFKKKIRTRPQLQK